MWAEETKEIFINLRARFRLTFMEVTSRLIYLRRVVKVTMAKHADEIKKLVTITYFNLGGPH